MGTERGYGGAEGEGGGSRVVRLNDSHVTKPSRTVCVCVCVCVCVWLQCMHWSFLLIQPFTTFSLPYD